ncbi:MAG: DUF2283 domain-containing protein [FCB group bacterium]|jgi:uncharacterized protein YuzE|nr:DUF2283 domain-containing protein [FCB group bacterium]
MRITYDPQADALDIRLREGNFQCRTVRLNDDIALDFAEGEVLVAIEILRASELGVTPEHPEVILERLRGIVDRVA